MLLSTVIILGMTFALGVVGLVTLSYAVSTSSWKTLLWLIPHAFAVGFFMFALHDITHWGAWDYILTGVLGFAVYIFLAIVGLVKLYDKASIARKNSNHPQQ